MLLTSLFALQRAETGFNLRNTLALNVPLSFQLKPEQAAVFYKEAIRRITELPGVEHVAVGTAVPWRDAGVFGPGFQFTVQGYAKANGEEDPRARFRTVSPSSSPRLAFRSSQAVTFRRRTGVTPSRWSSSARASRNGCSRTRTR